MDLQTSKLLYWPATIPSHVNLKQPTHEVRHCVSLTATIPTFHMTVELSVSLLCCLLVLFSLSLPLSLFHLLSQFCLFPADMIMNGPLVTTSEARTLCSTASKFHSLSSLHGRVLSHWKQLGSHYCSVILIRNTETKISKAALSGEIKRAE